MNHIIMQFKYKVLDSTINKAFELINCGKYKDFSRVSIIATEQTAGVSSKEKISWYSPYGNLYLTIVFNKNVYQINQNYHFTFCAGLAVREFITMYHPYLIPLIKWPNDILIDDKKICGILAQDYKNFLILSIGLNLLAYPKKTLNFPATSLMEVIKKYNTDIKWPNKSLDYNFVAEQITILLEKYVKILNQQSFEYIKHLWLKHAYRINSEISIIETGEKLIFNNISNNGTLIGIDCNGQKRELFHGEIKFNKVKKENYN